MVDDDKNMDTSLEWKNHNDFYRYLNEMSNKASLIESAVYIDNKQIYSYFAIVSSILSKHRAYINNYQDKRSRLNNIRKGLYAENFKKDLDKGGYNPRFNDTFTKMLDNMVEIYSEIVEELVRNELFPKVKKFKKYNPKDAILG